MTSSRPYLIRALYEWIVDNGLTPYILVDVEKEGLNAPTEYADNGKLVLNIAPRAVRELNVGNDAITFSARFGGSARDVFVPVLAVMAIRGGPTRLNNSARLDKWNLCYIRPPWAGAAVG